MTLLATVKLEISSDPPAVYFRDMNMREEKNQRVHLKNTSGNLLLISSINPGDPVILVDLLNRTPDWPIELKQDETLDLMVSFKYQEDKPRVTSQITINYKGGEGNVANIRFYASLKTKHEKPQKRTKPLPEVLNQQENDKPESVETSPSKEDIPTPPPPPDMPLKEEIIKPQEIDPK